MLVGGKECNNVFMECVLYIICVWGIEKDVIFLGEEVVGVVDDGVWKGG